VAGLVVAVRTGVVAAVGQRQVSLVGGVDRGTEEGGLGQIGLGAGGAKVAGTAHGLHQRVDLAGLSRDLAARCAGVARSQHLDSLLQRSLVQCQPSQLGRGAVEMHHLADIAEEHAGAVRLDAQVQPHLAAVQGDAIGVQAGRGGVKGRSGGKAWQFEHGQGHPFGWDDGGKQCLRAPTTWALLPTGSWRRSGRRRRRPRQP
jgi:hypothetical protein